MLQTPFSFPINDLPEKDSAEDFNTTSETSSDAVGTTSTENVINKYIYLLCDN